MNSGIELPEGWSYVNLGEIAEIRGGIQKQPKRVPKSNAHPYLRVANVLRGRLDLEKIECMELFGNELEHYCLQAGDLLVVEGNGSLTEIGRSALWKDEINNCVHQNHIIRVRLATCLPQYLDYFWNSPFGVEQVTSAAVTTTGLFSLSTKKVAGVRVPIAPLAEQRRIVEKVDALLTQVNAARERLAKVPAILMRFRQAVLAAACSGRLTEDWREKNTSVESAAVLLERCRKAKPKESQRGIDSAVRYTSTLTSHGSMTEAHGDLPELPDSWCWVAHGELLLSIEAGKSPLCEGRPAKEHEFGVLKVSAVSWSEFDPNENKALFPDYIPPDGLTVRSGDLLISRANTVDLVGAVVLVDREYGRLMLSDKTLRLVVDEKLIEKNFLLYALRSKCVRERFEADATGTSDSMRNLSQDKIRSAPIPLPPVSEQREIAGRVAALFSAADAIARRVRAGLDCAERLPQAILSKAFSGDLVPTEAELARQGGRSYEPASLLMERLYLERSLGVGGNKRSRKSLAPLGNSADRSYQ